MLVITSLVDVMTLFNSPHALLFLHFIHFINSHFVIFHSIIYFFMLLLYIFIYIHCVQKKTPTHIFFISPWIICGFKQELQWIYPRIGRFWQCKN